MSMFQICDFKKYFMYLNLGSLNFLNIRGTGTRVINSKNNFSVLLCT